MMYHLYTAALLFTVPGQAPVSQQENAIVFDDYAPCGLTSLYLVCRIREVSASWQQVKEAVGPSGAGGELSFAELAPAAEKVGLHPVALEAGRVALHDLPMPAILQVHDSTHPDELPHFLVLLKPENDGVWLLDAPFPAYFLSEDRFQQSWTGRVMVFAENEAEANRIRGTARQYQLVNAGTWILLVGGLLAIGYMIINRLACRGPSIVGRFALTAQRFVGKRRRAPTYLSVGILAVLFFVSGSLAAVLVRHYARRLPPQCAFIEPVFELGELKLGGQKTRVSIQNKGDDLLQIAEVQSSCSCAIAKHPNTIGSHDSADIDLELNVGPGPGGAYLTVISNDPSGAKHIFLQWHGKTEPFLNPRWIAESGVRLDQPYERTVHLLFPGGKSALLPQLEGYECPDACVEVRTGRNDSLATKFATSGFLTKILGQIEIQLKVKPPPIPTVLQTVCLLKVKYGEAHISLRLPMLLSFCGGELSPSATAVTFSAANRKELLSEVRTIAVRDQVPHSDLEVAGVPEWLSCQVECKTEHDYLIHLKLLEAPGVGLAQQTIHIARKKGAKVPIPLQLNVLAPSS